MAALSLKPNAAARWLAGRPSIYAVSSLALGLAQSAHNRARNFVALSEALLRGAPFLMPHGSFISGTDALLESPSAS